MHLMNEQTTIIYARIVPFVRLKFSFEILTWPNYECPVGPPPPPPPPHNNVRNIFVFWFDSMDQSNGFQNVFVCSSNNKSKSDVVINESKLRWLNEKCVWFFHLRLWWVSYDIFRLLFFFWFFESVHTCKTQKWSLFPKW